MWFRSTYFSLRSRAGFLRVGFLAYRWLSRRLNLTAHALQFGVQYQPEETNLGRTEHYYDAKFNRDDSGEHRTGRGFSGAAYLRLFDAL